MILKIWLNETETITNDLNASLTHLYDMLQELSFFDPKDLCVALVTRMYGGCDILSLTVGSETLRIERG